MASTPKPRAKNGTIWVVLALKVRPRKAQRPRPPATVIVTRRTPLRPRAA